MDDLTKLTISKYNRSAEQYVDNFFEDTKDEIPYLNEFFKSISKKSKVLDAGCGPGTFTRILSEKGFDSYGIDLSNKMVELAREKVPKASFSVMNLFNLNFKDEFFDAIIAMYSLIHIPSENLPKVIDNFNRVLKEAGKLFVAVQSKDYEGVREFGLGGNAFVHFYLPDDLKAVLEKSEFTVNFQKLIDWYDPVEKKMYKILFMGAQKAFGSKKNLYKYD